MGITFVPPPLYSINLVSTNLMNDQEYLKHVMAVLMLFSFDYETAHAIIKTTSMFEMDVIHLTENREDILMMEKIFIEENIKVIVNKFY